MASLTSSGLPTPVFNFIRRIVLFLVASTATDNIKMNAAPLAEGNGRSGAELEQVCRVFGAEVLRQVDETEFYRRLPEVRRAAGGEGHRHPDDDVQHRVDVRAGHFHGVDAVLDHGAHGFHGL